MKHFFCRVCKVTADTEDGYIPEGWYSLTRSWRSSQIGFARLGLYCSIECLSQYVPVLSAESRTARDPRLVGAR